MFHVFLFCSRGSALGFTTSELAVCVTELYSRNQGSKPSKVKVKSAYEPKWPIRSELIPVSVALSD